MFVEIIDEFLSLVDEVRQYFHSACLEVKLRYLQECEEMLGACVIVERELTCSTVISRTINLSMQTLVSSVQELLALMETSLIQHVIPGHPTVDVPEQQLLSLLTNDFNLADMGQILSCSTRTVQRRTQELALNRRQRYSGLSDSEIDDTVYTIQNTNPRTGYRMVDGIFRSNGHILQRRRIRESLQKVDPNGSQGD